MILSFCVALYQCYLGNFDFVEWGVLILKTQKNKQIGIKKYKTGCFDMLGRKVFEKGYK
jgi:hypothetical protein